MQTYYEWNGYRGSRPRTIEKALWELAARLRHDLGVAVEAERYWRERCARAEGLGGRANG